MVEVREFITVPLCLWQGAARHFMLTKAFISVGLCNAGSVYGDKNDNLRFLLGPLQSWFCSHRDLKCCTSGL